MKPRLIVFTKAPVIGGAKSRLAAGIGKVAAWRVYRAMLSRLTRRLRDPRWDLLLAVAPDRALGRRFPGAWPGDLARVAQGGGDLGARQARAFSSPACGGGGPRSGGGGCTVRARPHRPALRAGHLPRERGRKTGDAGPAPTLVIGSDAPQVTHADIAAAFKALKRHGAVIGPAADGGYWLLGLNGGAPAGLFDGVRWSHPETLSDLKARMRACGITRIAHLRTLRDVDEAGDLKA